MLTFPLTPDLIQEFEQMYSDGAWTPNEVYSSFKPEHISEFYEKEYIMSVQTDMGLMTMLGKEGRRAISGSVADALSINSQIDYAYRRLCIAEMGWQEVDPELSPLDLKQFDPRDIFVEYNTEYGFALVTGKISRKGYATASIHKLLDRLRAPALRYGFKIIIFVPGGQGKKLANRNPETLKVIEHIPDTGDEEKRLKVMNAVEGMSPEGAVLTPVLANNLLAQGRITDFTANILQLTRRERVDQARAAIDLDGVMSRGQLETYFGLKDFDMTGQPYVDEIIRPVHTAYGYEQYCRFFIADKAVEKMDANGMGHRAGTAEIRHQLGAPPDITSWLVEQRSKFRSEEPDATWLKPSGEKVAIEFDTGSYSMPTVWWKLETFRQKGFDLVEWAVSSPRRQKNLHKKLEMDVRLAEWWKPKKIFSI